MGGVCCGSGELLSAEARAALEEERIRSQELEKNLQRENAMEERVKKLLLLGAGESGKSTLFKQMITIYGKGFSEEDRREYYHIIHKNTMSSIITLCQQSEILADEGLNTNVLKSNVNARDFILDRKEGDPIEAETALAIARLWKDPGIQCTYENRNRFQLIDSANYFIGKVREICHEDYVPTEQDVLRSRVRTTGIVENTFQIDGNEFRMFDVGGQRNERKKWIHCFDEVTAVLFVASLSCYDLMLYEDRNTNRMDEALMLFQEICNSRWFKNTSIILMLNKRDLFADKIKKVPLTVCFPDYAEGDDYDAGCEFIQEQFESKVKDGNKQIYTHITCATDTSNMRHVFMAVKDIVIRQSLAEGGLLS